VKRFRKRSLLKVLTWIRSAEKSGRLEVDFYPPEKRPTQYAGWTDFELTLEYKYEQQMKWKITREKTVNVTIYPTFTTIKTFGFTHSQIA